MIYSVQRSVAVGHQLRRNFHGFFRHCHVTGLSASIQHQSRLRLFDFGPTQLARYRQLHRHLRNRRYAVVVPSLVIERMNLSLWFQTNDRLMMDYSAMSRGLTTVNQWMSLNLQNIDSASTTAFQRTKVETPRRRFWAVTAANERHRPSSAPVTSSCSFAPTIASTIEASSSLTLMKVVWMILNWISLVINVDVC